MAERAKEPRYSIPEAASFIRRPSSTVRRWSLGNTRKQHGERTRDEPLIVTDGLTYSSVPLSFLNLLELRFLGVYRSRMPLQSIRRALEYAGDELKIDRPLLSLEFKVRGKELFLKFATGGGDGYLVNASRRGQIQIAWPASADEFIGTLDYDEREHSAFRWWPLGRQEPVIIDTTLNGGIPSTALSGVRTNAIAVHHGEGLELPEIADDVGASVDEVRAALRFERIAA
jgi:hypothetical protein